jgi:hypothetical protein
VSEVPAGWYDDGSGSLRYWDGTFWTEYTAARYSPPAPASGPAKKAGRWLWLTIGGVAAVLAALTVVVIVGLSGSHDDDVEFAKGAVKKYDSAWYNVDCDALIAATTAAFREGWGYDDCSVFEEDASDFNEAVRDYKTTVNTATFESGHVTIATTESYIEDGGDVVSDHVTYTVVHEGDVWRIDDIEFADDDAETPV